MWIVSMASLGVKLKSPRIKTFLQGVCQQLEFASFGPCSEEGSVISVHAFDQIKRYPINAKLEMSMHRADSFWRFPNMLSQTTKVVCEIIEDAFVKQGMPVPGSTSTLRIAAEDLPYSIEIRYLWLMDPVANDRNVLAILFDQDIPLWATESRMDYYSKKDTDLVERVRSLSETYLSQHPAPSGALKKILPEIVEMVESI